MLSQALCVGDMIPITITMDEGRKTFSHCKLTMRIIRGKRIPERLFTRPSSFVTVYWDHVCPRNYGEYPSIPSREAEKLENRHVLFHTPEVVKEVDPEWNYTSFLSVTPSSFQKNEKIRFVVRQYSNLRLLAEGSVALATICNLIHDQTNLQNLVEGESSVPLTVSLPLTTNREDDKTALVIEFSIQTIPNQALFFIRRHIYLHGFQWRTIQNLLRVSLLYRSRDAIPTLLTIGNTFSPKDQPDKHLIHFIETASNLYHSLYRIAHFSSDLHRDYPEQEYRNLILTQYIMWIGSNTSQKTKKLLFNQHYSKKSILGFAVAQGNLDLFRYLLSCRVNLLLTHWYEYKEYFIDELIEHLGADAFAKEYSAFLCEHPISEECLLAKNLHLHVERDIRQKKFDLTRQCFFPQKADRFIEELASAVVYQEKKIKSLFYNTTAVVRHYIRGDDDDDGGGCLENGIAISIECLVDEWKEIEAKNQFNKENEPNSEEISLFTYCDFSSLITELSEQSQIAFDNEEKLKLCGVVENVFFLFFSLFFRCNIGSTPTIISPSYLNVVQLLDISDRYVSIQKITLKAISLCVDFHDLTESMYRDAMIILNQKLCELLSNAKEEETLRKKTTLNGLVSSCDFGKTSLLYHYLDLFRAFTENPRACILKLCEPFLEVCKLFLAAPASFGFHLDAPDSLNDDVLTFYCLLVQTCGNLARTIQIANYFVDRGFLPELLRSTKKYKNIHTIYQPSMVLLNRLFAEDKNRSKEHSRDGWPVLAPSIIKGGAAFLAQNLNSVIDLMWYGLNTFCYSRPLACTSACSMVWRLLYYNCIPETELTDFIDSFCSKFRRLWNSTDIIELKICILKVLRRILHLSILDNTHTRIHLAIEHDFLSYSYKCIKQYGHANKAQLIRVALEFLACLALNEKINYQLTQDPDWIVAEHLMDCLSHPDTRENAQLQHSGFWLIGRLAQASTAILFSDILASIGMVHHLFEYVFAHFEDPTFQLACSTACSALLVMIPTSSIRTAFFRMDGIRKMVGMARVAMEWSEPIVRSCLLLIHGCCAISSYARKMAAALQVPQLVSVACIKYSGLQSVSAVRELLTQSSKRGQRSSTAQF